MNVVPRQPILQGGQASGDLSRMASAARGVVLTKTSSSCSPGLTLPGPREPGSQGDRLPSRVIRVIHVIPHQDQRLFIFSHFVLLGHMVLREAASCQAPRSFLACLPMTAQS